MGLFQLVLASSLDGPRPEQMNLSDLMTLLTENPDSKKTAPKDVVYAFELLSKSFRFSTARWLEILARSRRQDVLRTVTGTGGSGSSAGESSLAGSKLAAARSDGGKGEANMSEEPSRRKRGHRHRHHHAKKKSRNADDTHSGTGLLTSRRSEQELESAGSDSVPAIYTRVGFEREMKPSLIDAEKRLPSAPLSPEQRQALERYLLDQARRYARNYRDAQVAYLLGYRPKAETLPAVLALLDDLQQPSSPLLERLRVVADNLNLGKLEGPYFAPLAEQLASLAPILKLGTPKDGAYPDYDKYKAIIAKLARELAGEDAAPATPIAAAAPAPDKAGKPAAPSPELPSSAARVALANLQGVEGSAQQKLDTYLDTAGLVGDLRRPFTVPLLRVHRLGLTDVETSVQTRYDEELRQRIRPLLERFPFSRSAGSDVAMADLQQLKPPSGAIYQFVQRQIAPMYSEKPDGTLVPLKNPLGTLKLSDSLLATASRLRRLSKALWTEEGVEKPIALLVKPLPLPPVGGNEQVVTQTFLSCSNVSVYGFNQMPESKPFPLPWWRQETSAAGIELGSASSKTRRYQSIDAASSPWSFFHLLEKAQWEGLTATWRIENEAPGPARSVRFAFESDPWALFKSSSSSRSRERE
jgi:type VI protein secretion system component VasK